MRLSYQFFIRLFVLILVISCSNPSQQLNSLKPYEVVEVRVLDSSCLAKDGSCPRVEFQIPYFKHPRFQQLNFRIINDLAATMSRAEVSRPDLEYLKDISVQQMKSYQQFKSNFPNRTGAWFATSEFKELWLNDSIISISLKTHKYRGGAHALEQNNLYTVNLETGMMIDIAERLGKDRLTKAAELVFREQLDLPSDSGLNSRGHQFINGRFKLPFNMAYVADGVFMHYNPYEIGPYSLGDMELLVTYDRLREF